MIAFKRILYPVDFSAHCTAVRPFVDAMAKRFGSEVMERNVRPDEGDPAERILAYAEEHQIDLIMMGTHGHSPFRALLLGSVTTKVLHRAHCPVWTAVHAEELTAHLPDHWTHMLCGIDDEEKDLPVLKWATEFAQEQKMELLLAHAVAGTGAMWMEESDPSMVEFLFHTAQERLDKLDVKDVRLGAGPVGTAVRHMAVQENADLIVIGRGAPHQGLGRLRSNAEAIIREAPCPVISI